MKERLPVWMQDWVNIIWPVSQIALIVVLAWLLRKVTNRLLIRLKNSYHLPAEMILWAERISNFLIYMGALLLILERLGVSGTVLWTAFTGFAAVAAVAFFAAWSVLSNIFCTVLIFTTRPFRLNDRIELLENGEKPGLKGKVIDINLIYTTLEETVKESNTTILQVPNNLFFQRTLRRWQYHHDDKPEHSDSEEKLE